MISIGCRSQRPKRKTQANALAVVTEWNQFRNPDFLKIKEELSAPIVFDGRNLYSPELLAEKAFAYFCIGRK